MPAVPLVCCYLADEKGAEHILPQLVGHVGWKRDDETCIHEAADSGVGDLDFIADIGLKFPPASLKSSGSCIEETKRQEERMRIHLQPTTKPFIVAAV